MPSESPEDVQADGNDQAKPALEGLACNGCRKAKLRCSRDRPNCVHCRKTGLDCVYESKRIKPGLKPGAVENLHRRLDELERRLEEKDAINTRSTRGDGESSAASISSGSDSAAHDILVLLARELPKLVHQTKVPATPTDSSNERASKRRRTNDDRGGGLHPHDTPVLPGPDLLEPILSAYFKHVHPWIPMIHQGRFFQRLANETERDRMLTIIHSMVLAASKFVPGAAEYSDIRTRNWVVCKAMDCISVDSLQSLIILAFNDIGDGNAEKVWSIIGSMTRTVEYAQLAQEQEENEQRPFFQPYAPLQHTHDWTETEERRRVFWNIFLLDRLCSVTTGWNTSLTSDDVFRRLPCDGHLWRKQEPVPTPYFGIWDKSKGRIGNPIDYMSRHPSPGHGGNNLGFHNSASDAAIAPSYPQNQSSDMSTVGALAYNIEATESMSRVMSYFLQQKVNVREQSDISSWLTRFKELDLRLVHWKMLLPQKWKANPNLTRHVPLMDPNLTTAHVTHNASMILLHQTIAYPPLHWGFRNRLPSSCSAEACYSAGIEIATITQKYLCKSLADSPVGSQYAFCIFIAARVLLVHWRYAPGNELPVEFESLVQSLEEMSARWNAFSELSSRPQNLFTKYATRLKQLYEACSADPTYHIDVMDYTRGSQNYAMDLDPAASYQAWSSAPPNLPHMLPEMGVMLPSNGSEPTDLNTIPQIMLDQDFIDLDRVIAFDDGSMFSAAFDSTTAAW